jgi:hypothetical protein
MLVTIFLYGVSRLRLQGADTLRSADHFRRGDDWWLDLNGVHDMTRDEARELSEAAFEIRDEIRAVLMLRRALPTVHY